MGDTVCYSSILYKYIFNVNIFFVNITGTFTDPTNINDKAGDILMKFLNTNDNKEERFLKAILKCHYEDK